jgi:hypothetical protein
VSNGALVGGGNVTLRLYDDEVFYNSFIVVDFRLVSIPQIIVDLLREGGPAIEAADMMIEKYGTVRPKYKERANFLEYKREERPEKFQLEDEHPVLYSERETGFSKNLLEKILKERPKPTCLLGGWAVY